MSDLLSCDCTMKATHEPRYWWPLIFEAMHQVGLDFVDPQKSDGTGLVLSYSNLEGEANAFEVSTTFRGFWDRAYVDQEYYVVHFRSRPMNDFEIWAGLQIDDNHSRISLDLTLPIESLLDAVGHTYSAEELAQRLCSWLDSVYAIYTFCGPAEAHIYWDKGDRLVGCIGTDPENIGPVPPGSTIRHRGLPDGTTMSLLDPFPVPRRGKRVFVDLGECKQTESGVRPPGGGA